MLYRELMAVCSEIHTKHINTVCGQNVELLNVKLAVRKEHLTKCRDCVRRMAVAQGSVGDGEPSFLLGSPKVGGVRAAMLLHNGTDCANWQRLKTQANKSALLRALRQLEPLAVSSKQAHSQRFLHHVHPAHSSVTDWNIIKSFSNK
jgi:hypothetical protein